MSEKKGIIKKIDNFGRITIPKAWRQILGADSGAEVEVIFIDEDTIEIKIKRDEVETDGN